jgi:plastocyanin
MAPELFRAESAEAVAQATRRATTRFARVLDATRRRLRAGAALLAIAALGAGCGSDPDERTAGQILRLGVVTAPGKVAFDKKRLEAKAGKVTIELRNDKGIAHNVRVQTGRRCCFASGSEDVGGTPTVVNQTIRATLDLKPGTYQFLCSIGGHWQRGQRGVLVVRG